MNGNEDNNARQEAELWFARRLEPSVRENERAAFERWRTGDVRRAEAYAATERLWDELGGLKQMEDMPPSMAQLAAANPAWKRGWRNPLVRYPLLAGLAASLVAAVALTLTTLDREHAVPTQVVATALGEQRTVKLADGTTLRLNTQSVVEVRMTRHRREVRLRTGEAAFDVAQDASRPFVVAAGDGTVTALGTQFEVRNMVDAVAVTLMEGRVQIARISHGEVESLRPGQQASYSENADGIVTRNVDVAALTSWMTGRLEFRGTPLKDIVAEANRYSAKKIRIGDPSIGGLAVSGTFRTGDTDHIVTAFEAALPVRAEDSGVEVVLYGR